MQYRSIEQGVRCERLKDAARDAQLRARSWNDHTFRLQEDINIENRLLEDLHRQADRTGDQEGFAPDIRRSENKIANLERQTVEAEDNARQWREEVDRLENEMAQSGCAGFV